MNDGIREAIVGADPELAGERMNRLADEYRSGRRDAGLLAAALDSDDREVVSLAAWILGEIRFDLYCTEELLSRLRRLTGHDDAAVRFHALGALFPALKRGEPGTEALLQRLLQDPNDGVRGAAQATSARLSEGR